MGTGPSVLATAQQNLRSSRPKHGLASGWWHLGAHRGGGVYLSNDTGLPEEDSDFTEARIGSRGFGLLDLGFTPSGKTFWTVGGSGSVFYSTDGGKKWSATAARITSPPTSTR